METCSHLSRKERKEDEEFKVILGCSEFRVNLGYMISYPKKKI